jgi:hypothetical protein
MGLIALADERLNQLIAIELREQGNKIRLTDYR